MKKMLLAAVFPAIVLITLFIYKQSLSFYFFQDDWFVLDTIKNIHLNNIFSIFSARQDVVYYRPVGMQLFFFLSKSLFGLNPINFHLLSFFFHILNIFMIGLISFQIFRSKFASAVSSFFYAVASFHFMTLSWISLTWNNIGTFFVFSSIYFYLKFSLSEKLIDYFLAVSLFFVALFSTEFAALTPIIAALISLLSPNKINFRGIKKTLLILSPPILAIIVYISFRLTHSAIQTTSDYKIVISTKIIKNLIWYFLWLTGVPQELKFNLSISQLKIARAFLNGAGFEILLFFLFWLGIIILAIFLLKKNKSPAKLNIVVALIFLIGLIPVIFLPNHTFPYYLNISSLGPFLFIAFLLKKNARKGNEKFFIINYLIIIIWLFLSFTNYRINAKTNWIPGEAIISKKITEDALIQSANNSNYSPVVIVSEDAVGTEQSLTGQRALQIILNNPNIKTYVRKREQAINDYKMGTLPKNAYYIFYYQ